MTTNNPFVFEKMVGAVNVRLLDLLQELEPKIKGQEEPLALFALLMYRMNLGNALIRLERTAIEGYFDENKMPLPEKLQNKNNDDDELKTWRADCDAWKSLCLAALEKKCLETYPSLMGENRLFVLDGERLFAQKFFAAKQSIISRMDILFGRKFTFDGDIEKYIPKDIDDQGHALEGVQREIVEKGVIKNLLITGGPGTGKTSVVSSIIKTLRKCGYKDAPVYYTAPSGKAANNLHPEGKTIHSLLSYDPKTGDFKYRKNHPLPTGIFVIDEASMIDISIFAALLEAIPDDARVFILGDKDQLPSVDVGAVFSELLQKYGCETLVETHRFGKEVLDVADDINTKDGAHLSNKHLLPDYDFKKRNISILESFDVDDFVKEWVSSNYDTASIAKLNSLKDAIKDLSTEDDMIPAELFDTCSDVWNRVVETAKVLCCENEGPCGVSTFNEKIVKILKSKRQHIFDVMMITRNIKDLGLFNGDTGLALGKWIIFKTTKMVKKSNVPGECDKDDRGFEETKFRIMPLGRIDSESIVRSFAMTVHKSQGSGYNSVALVLPEKENHPLLNRQILYTAITRTKNVKLDGEERNGLCVILSSVEKLQAGARKAEVRETGVV